MAKVIYFSAVVPGQGTSMADENAEYGQAIHESIATTPDGTVVIPLEAVRMGLMPNESAPLQELVFQMMLPQPGSYMTDSLDVPEVTKIGLDAAYVLGTDDISLARPGTEFAGRLGVEPLMVPGGHMGMLSHPKDVADALISLL